MGGSGVSGAVRSNYEIKNSAKNGHGVSVNKAGTDRSDSDIRSFLI